MRKLMFTLGALLALFQAISAQMLKSPGELLGYEPGTQFTYHHKAIEYFRYISDNSDLAEYREYGITNEGRPLAVCFVSSAANLAKLEEYRKNNLIKTGLMNGTFSGKQVPFVWLGYNVHGNEAVGMEAAMKTLYTLVSGTYEGTGKFLESCIIIIDPCQNPDGHELYTNRYRSSMNLLTNPDRNAWEHNQGWPGARTNHYLFDLNRDWTWQTQYETQQRLTLYKSIMPQVHADFHEMGPESTFFFAPGADPWNNAITPWQKEFHKLMGNGNAALFNQKFRLYFTKENYDLFYPSYGDTWPLFNGAMGFTYEQGGGGGSGLAYEQESGDTLTLKERIEGHFTASMATIRVASENSEKLISEFNRYFEDAVKNPSFPYKSVIIKGANEKSSLSALLNLLDINQIRYSSAGNTGKKVKGFDYLRNANGETTIEKGDILVSAYQPQSHLIQVLFEPDTKTSDSLSYDLTAWALPYIYNIRAFATEEKITADTAGIKARPIVNQKGNKDLYAYLANFSGFDELRFMAALYRKNIKIRYSLKPFQLNGDPFERGSIIVARGDNKYFNGDFDETVVNAANQCQVKLIRATTGLVERGKDFGSSNSLLMKKRNVAIIGGDGTSSGSLGELWYFFERELEYPVTIIEKSEISAVTPSKYEIMILTSGNYTEDKESIMNYLKNGGRVIALENAVSLFTVDKNTSISKAVDTRSEEVKLTEKKIKSDDSTLLRKYEYENERRYSLTERSAGSIYRVKLDETHPYAFGMGKEWFIMKRTSGFPFLAKGNNIGYILEKEPVSGFAGSKFRSRIKNTLVIGSENIGEGEVIYISDDPYFRAFWKSGRVLLGNMILR